MKLRLRILSKPHDEINKQHLPLVTFAFFCVFRYKSGIFAIALEFS